MTTAPDTRQTNAAVVGAALTVTVSGALYLNALVNWRHAALFLVGVFAGVVLYHAAFGFTSAWRVFVSDRRSAGVRAQMLMLAVACLLFIPLLAMRGPVLGVSLRGCLAPVGVASLIGAFLIGLRMQLGRRLRVGHAVHVAAATPACWISFRCESAVLDTYRV